MLDSETKRRIDNARDILVGKVPDPKSQVEQITIALIYKFMDDMDAEAEEMGGFRKFFANGYARYGWAKLMHSGLGGHETLNLYAEAITKMPENPGIPPLFRDIFKNAYLPYRDPETLRAFLKIIDEFEYDHSERLGDAFEYLLSVLGSQGDAGQFRTPRHIIDFIVEIVDPKKHETVLDPACGTAGFLISAYKHILRSNSGFLIDDCGFNNPPIQNPQSPIQNLLTPDERGRLADNFKGYDISPDMVRLSLVNMYLHGFTDPHIYEYDTLTSQERWNEYADVILANPPFMSPKGGIKPHNRFSVQSKRSEVLFVDYMAEHLRPSGRAGIIVPEGIIFQSQTAYTQLRKMLVEDYLVGVISLPSGVFMPYTGVKTSILVFDRAEARRNPNIIFADVRQIGFSLGVKRIPSEQNDLPHVVKDFRAYYVGGELSRHSWLAPRAAILANGCNLTGSRYRPKESGCVSEMVRLGEVLTRNTDEVVVEASKDYREITVRLWGKGVVPRKDSGIGPVRGAKRFVVSAGQFILSKIDARNGACGIVPLELDGAIASQDFPSFNIDAGRLDVRYLDVITKAPAFVELCLIASEGTTNRVRLHEDRLLELQIPLPPLEVQNQIVAEIEGYQKVIDGARAVLDNYRPHIPIHPDWPMVELRDACEINPETVNPESEYPFQTIHYIDISSVENGTGRFLGYTEVAGAEAPSRARRVVRPGDVLLSTVRPNLKAFTLLRDVRERAVASTGFAVLRSRVDVLDPVFLLTCVSADHAVEQMVGMMGRGAYPSINQSDVAAIKIALPPLATQLAIVAEIEAEQALVNANRDLIARMEKKIQAVLARVWGLRITN